MRKGAQRYGKELERRGRSKASIGINPSGTKELETPSVMGSVSDIGPWPRSLLKAVVASLQRPPNSAEVRGFLGDAGWPAGIIEALIKDVRRTPLRFFIIDDSGSMNMRDGLKLVRVGHPDARFEKCTRWEELADSIVFHARLACIAEIPTEFRLLNGADPCLLGLGDRDESRESLTFLMDAIQEVL